MRLIPAILLLLLLVASARGNEDSLPPLTPGKAAQSFDQLWAGYDPRHEPLEIQILKEWEEEGVILRVIRYRIGVFRGKKAWMAAIYGFPKNGRRLPGLVQMHGGGQSADYRASLINAKRGYATIALAWAGRLRAPGYQVDSTTLTRFLAGQTDAPDYKITTDWGSVDGYHAPRRNEKFEFSSIKPSEWSLDPFDSARNTGWFLCTLAARRALTFLEQQPEVDPQKLGVYGHSMGGKLTVMTAAADRRVKAAAPSCGGVSDRYRFKGTLYESTISDAENLRHITCPIIFLSPANDFHGRILDLQTALDEIATLEWRVTSSPHHNHQDTADYMVSGLLWFDHHLLKSFDYPRTPTLTLSLKTGTGVPLVHVTPSGSGQVAEVNVYYSHQGPEDPDHSIGGSDLTRNRFWHHASARLGVDGWEAGLPLCDTGKPLWVYANVVYALEEPVVGASYYHSAYTARSFNVSSRLRIVPSAELVAAGITPAKPSLVIESFAGDWEKEWFSYGATPWEYRTHKVYDALWAAPAQAALALQVRCVEENTLVIRIDNHVAAIHLTGGSEWQQVRLRPADFKDVSGLPLAGWRGIKELRLSPRENLSAKVRGESLTHLAGGQWRGLKPEFRNLRWTLDQIDTAEP